MMVRLALHQGRLDLGKSELTQMRTPVEFDFQPLHHRRDKKGPLG